MDEKADAAVMIDRQGARPSMIEQGQLTVSVEALHRMINELGDEVDEMLRVLVPISQPALETVATPSRGDDPMPPASELTRAVREATDRINAQRDRLRTTRAYLDLT